MSERADVVVVGGGVMGAAALRYLAELGCRQPLLLERETLASGSTGHCAGGVRTLFSDELNVRIGVESIRRLQRFEEEVGEQLDLRLDGYLFLLDDPADLDRFEADLVLQAAAGVESRVLTPDGARELVPQLAVDDLCGAVFNPVAGTVTPDLVVQGCARQAARLGARVEQGCAVKRILVGSGRVTGVETARGRIETDRVVVTAGVWSRELAATAGLDLPVKPERRYMHVTGAAPEFPERLPLTIDFSTSFYFHREGRGILFGGAELDDLAPVAARRLPALAELELRHTMSGFYEMSPDHNALVGAAPEPAGLLYATGFSGHGFQQGLVVGEHLAELALGREPTFDLSQFSVERFARGNARAELNVI
ncbi:MAG TPA: FAD-binding oxidoreductase [Gaiellaceae bacterium]|nr:FAD-binding oxidoreductase [Gaiellaceae bacterium]